MAARTAHTSDPLVFRAAEGESQMARAAALLDWPLRGTIDRDPDAGVPYEAQWGVGGGPTLHYVVHDLSDSSFFFASSDDPLKSAATAGLAAQFLDVMTFDELLADLDRAKTLNQIGRSAMRATLGAPAQTDDRLVSRLRELLHSKDADVREATIWAITLNPWNEYRPLLTDRATKDRSPRIRELAGIVLEGYQTLPS